MILIPRGTRRMAAVLLLAAAAGCDDTGGTLAAPEARLLLLPNAQYVSCTGTVTGGGSVSCASNVPTTSVAVSNVTVSGGKIEFDATVQNLIPQPIGTEDGVTAHFEGVRVFFKTGPDVTQGGGFMSVANEDGTDSFTGGLEPYFQYSAVLDSGEVSTTRRVRLTFTPLVQGFAFSLGVSAAVPFPDGWVEVTPNADTLQAGESLAFTATVRDAYGAVVPGAPVTWSTSDSAATSVSPSGVVTGLAVGTANITATSSQISGSAAVTVTQECVTLAVGGVHVPSSNADVCLNGGVSGAEYTLVPVTLEGPVTLTVTASGIVPVTGAPRPGIFADGGGPPPLRGSRLAELRAAGAYEERLRERERAQLTPLIAGARRSPRSGRADAGARLSITPGVPTVGALMPLNVESTGSCTASTVRTGRVEVVGTHVIVMADTANPAGGTSYQAIADRFDSLVWPTLTGSFGAPADIDGNGRVIVFFTTAVNARTPAGQAPVTHGYTLRRDLFFTSSCAESNQGEMIYLAAADPSGTVNGNARSAASVDSFAARTIGHELAHLVNASRRLYVNFAPGFEDLWVDEGLADVAQELLYYAASGSQPRQNQGIVDITGDAVTRAAFLEFAEPNYARLRGWLRAPEAAGTPAAWAFLRYSADRKGGAESAFWSALVNSTTSGFANYAAAIGTAQNPWIRDFFTTLYTDDAMSGVAAPYVLSSWSLRSVYSALDYDGDLLGDGYPLAPRNPVDGVPSTFALSSSAAAYLRMGVPASGVATVTLRSGGAAPPSTLALAVVRRK